jgi:hypothetical protein
MSIPSEMMLCGFAAIAAGVLVSVPDPNRKNGPP